MNSFTIDGTPVGTGRVYVIAEAGVNHDGELAIAKELVRVAAAAGADAVKFQTFRAERLTSRQAPKAAYQVETTGGGESQFEMLKKLELSPEQFAELSSYCAAEGITFLSTPFDEDSADFLDQLGMPAFKIASGELTNLPLVRHIASKKKPMIVSTGMSSLSDVEAAVRAVEEHDRREFCLLHCTSSYPTATEDVNLRAMRTLRQAFDCPVGYSDHTVGSVIAFAAVALGAAVIEKHFTISREKPGPDHRASIEPHDLHALVAGIRSIEQALGSPRKEPTVGERDTAIAARRSIVAACSIPAGAVIEEAMNALRRPGTGLPPVMQPFVIGRVAKHAIEEGELVSLGKIL